MLLRGNFSPLRPSQFSPNSPVRFRARPGMVRPGFGPRPRMFAAATAARFAMRHRMPTIASVDQAGMFQGSVVGPFSTYTILGDVPLLS